MAYWLFKSEPQVFSIDDLRAQKKAVWDGVRSYQARNSLRDQVKPGDRVLFYHSSCPEPGVAGSAKVLKAGFPDPSAFDPGHKYYDPKSDPLAPRWFSVEVAFDKKAPEVLPLAWLREHAPGLPIFRLNRLSVVPLSPAEWGLLAAAAGLEPKGKKQA